MSYGTISLQVALDALPEGATLREHYSGRFMYGETCFGVIGNQTELFLFLAGLVNALVMNDDDPEVALDLAEAAKTDEMGLDKILYFPGWTVTREEVTS